MDGLTIVAAVYGVAVLVMVLVGITYDVVSWASGRADPLERLWGLPAREPSDRETA